MSYQGWKNYPTWCVKLWIDNDPGLYGSWRDSIQDAVNVAGSKEATSPSDIADALKDAFDEMAPTMQGLWADLFCYALGEVDWYEIAQAMIEDAEEVELEDAEEVELEEMALDDAIAEADQEWFQGLGK